VVGATLSYRFILVDGEVHGGYEVFREAGVGRERMSFLRFQASLLCSFGRSFFIGVSVIEVGNKFWGVF